MSQLSVIIPVKNGMPYLPRTISSTLRAMPKDSELLVLDDGSTDGTTEDGDTVLSKSFAALASAQLGYQGSASTILYNRPLPGQPYPQDPDIATFAHLVNQASEGLTKKDRKGVQDRLRSMYRL